MVADAFGSYGVPLRALAERAVAEQWIDVGTPRGQARRRVLHVGARRREPGAAQLLGHRRRRQSTLAHELGHAYHNTQLADRTPLQRQTPMALAETASIFCETILLQSLLSTADADRRLVLLETDLQGACQVVVDIHSRFLFEQAVFAKRAPSGRCRSPSCAS